MQALILDTTSLSRVGSGEFIPAWWNLEEVLQQAQQNLISDPGTRRAG